MVVPSMNGASCSMPDIFEGLNESPPTESEELAIGRFPFEILLAHKRALK